MRLIDADKYLEKLCTYKETGCGSCKLQTMCPRDVPEVDAIPVEWIDTYCTDCSINLRDNDTKAIKKLLEDWKMESVEATYKMLMEIFGIFIGCGLLLALISFTL